MRLRDISGLGWAIIVLMAVIILSLVATSAFAVRGCRQMRAIAKTSTDSVYTIEHCGPFQ